VGKFGGGGSALVLPAAIAGAAGALSTSASSAVARGSVRRRDWDGMVTSWVDSDVARRTARVGRERRGVRDVDG
jgi:hypothetical protein